MSKIQLLEASELIQKVPDFKEIFKEHDIATSYKKFQEFGGLESILRTCKTDPKRGLPDNETVLQQRSIFGSNKPIVKKMTPVWKLIVDCLGDLMLQILIVAAIVSMVLGLIENPKTGWQEGSTIILAIVLIISITAGNNYSKERQFAKLQSKLDDIKVQVKRGGEITQINAIDIVVGDLLLFQIGDLLVVDGVMIDGDEVKIDESAMTGESDLMKKIPITKIGDGQKVSPFIVSGTKVQDGQGVMLVLTNGQNTMSAQVRLLLEVENPPTPLQIKLEGVAEDIGKIGTICAIITFLALLVRLFISFKDYKEPYWDAMFQNETLSYVLGYFMIAITIIVMAVPEGLPLAVTITLAYSVNKMKDEQNLVRNLASCEIMGGANNICSDKTGTLTQNEMAVTDVFVDGQLYRSFEQFQKSSHKEMFVNCSLFNSNSYPVDLGNGQYQQTGNKTECALLIYCFRMGYKLSNYRPTNKVVRVIPFNSSRKKMFTVVDQDGQIILFAKGASEMIVEKCVRTVSGQEMDLNQKNIINNQITEFASKSLRTIGLAYKILNITREQAEHISEDSFDSDLTFIGIAGIKDPVRPSVPGAIAQCKKSGIMVRMVTGDNLITAKSIAVDCGILISADQNIQYEVMEGKEFRELTGGLIKEGNEYKIVYMDKFSEIAQRLRVLARATPEDKFILVTGLMQLDNVVAVTGDGTNDAPALKKASVGFAMGIAGTDVAREASDIIIMDDNFSSIVTACLWGRNIYNCIRKFIQFQLTVNLVALTTAVLGAMALSYSPLNSIQMLWVNMIMDTFASLALATEPPNRNLLDRKPYGKNESIVNGYMYRTVLGQSIYQIGVLCVILFSPREWFDLDKNVDINQNDLNQNDKKYDILRKSMFFQTFVLMQIFNSITARKLDDKSLNPFANLFNNSLFWIIFFIELGVQYLMIFFGGDFASIGDLDTKQHLIAAAFGVGILISGTLVRLVPVRWFAKLNIFDEQQLQKSELDATLSSKLRRQSSIRYQKSSSVILA